MVIFLGGRSLTGLTIAGSMLLTNISTEHLVGMNGSAYKNGFIIVAWEVTSAHSSDCGGIIFCANLFKNGVDHHSTIPREAI
jgi:SSS family solute:Na+ symporter